MSTANYTPLASRDDFRLVRVNRSAAASADEEPLSIEFLAARFDEECPYSALSYAWGKDPATIDIDVMGIHSPRLQITKSLADALQSLRKCDGRVFWIDALCIDQGNVEEKNIQVGRMAEIYRRATRVIIWLGLPSHDSDLAMEFIRNISTKDIDVLVTDGSISNSWVALASLLRRSWFTRRWVVQEVAFAKQAVLRCGTAMVSWTRFCETVSLFAEKFEEIYRPERAKSIWSNANWLDWAKALSIIAVALVNPTMELLTGGALVGKIQAIHSELSISPFGQLRCVGAHALITVFDRVLPHERDNQKPHRLCTMEPLLYYLPSFEVTDKRDVVFALASLAKDYSDFKPDYEQSVARVYKSAVQQAVKTSGSLNILCSPWAQPSTGLPSWVLTVSSLPFKPDQEGTYVRQHVNTLVCSSHQQVYHASGGSRASACFNDDESRFTVTCKGFNLPSIAWRGEPASKGRIPCSWDWHISNKVTSKQQRPQMYWRTLVADRDSSGNPPPPWYGLACDDVYTLCPDGTLYTTDLLPERKKKEGQTPRSLKAFIKRVQDVTWNRCLASLVGDNLALVPERTLLSDSICILLGCDVPVVLRRHEGDFWEVIGEAFVYGAMDGEAMERPHEDMMFNLI